MICNLCRKDKSIAEFHLDSNVCEDCFRKVVDQVEKEKQERPKFAKIGLGLD